MAKDITKKIKERRERLASVTSELNSLQRRQNELTQEALRLDGELRLLLEMEVEEKEKKDG